MKTHRVGRRWGSYIFCRQLAVRLSALRAGRPLPLVLISVRAWVDPLAIVLLEGLGKLKKNPPHRDSNRDLPSCSIVPQPTTLPRGSQITLEYDLWIMSRKGFEGRRSWPNSRYNYIFRMKTEMRQHNHYPGRDRARFRASGAAQTQSLGERKYWSCSTCGFWHYDCRRQSLLGSE
jgi:hypothetical protein